MTDAERRDQIHKEASRRWLAKYPDAKTEDYDEVYADMILERDKRIAELEAELLRVRTHENAAAHLLDTQLDSEERDRFKALADKLAEREGRIEELEEQVATYLDVLDCFRPIDLYHSVGFAAEITPSNEVLREMAQKMKPPRRWYESDFNPFVPEDAPCQK